MRSRLFGALALAALAAGLGVASPGRALAAHDRFVVAALNEPDTLDVSQMRNGAVDRATLENVMEGLVGFGADGQPTPGLATWEYSQGGKVITFHLRHGVKFQNGDPMTAADVAFSHERMAKMSPLYQRTIRTFDHLQVVDPHTIKFFFKEPNPSFVPARELFVLDKAYFDKVGEKEFVAHPIGTGPYRLADYKAGQYIDLDAFDGYWGGPPAVKKARIRYVREDTTRVAMLQAGEADVIMETPFNQVKALKAAGYKTATSAVIPTVVVQFGFHDPKVPWHDVRVREAIAHAIDTHAIVKDLLLGQVKDYAFLAPDDVGYDPTLKPYTYNPALAKKLLAEAGYPHGFSMPMWYWTGSYAAQRETTEAVALYLRAVGINPKVDGRDATQMIGVIRQYHSGPPNPAVLISPGPIANMPSSADMLNFVFSSHSPFAQYDNPAFDKLAAEANQTVDKEKQAELIKKAVRILHKDVVVIPIWTNVTVFSMQKNVDFHPAPRGAMLVRLNKVKIVH